MPQTIEVRDFQKQAFNVVLGNQRYRLRIWWNERCQKYTIQVLLNGVKAYGFDCLTCDGWTARGLPCFPASWGGLYLRTINDDVTGQQALPCGSKRLEFWTSEEIYRIFGTTRP